MTLESDEICSIVASNLKNKRKKTRKKNKIAHVFLRTFTAVSDKHPIARSNPNASTIYPKTDIAFSNTCKDLMISFSSVGTAGCLSSTNQSTKVVSNRQVELACASSNEMYAMPIHSNRTTDKRNSSVPNNTRLARLCSSIRGGCSERNLARNVIRSKYLV
mmetsp:Transcript_19420/g.27674  ORF Transcript_19420/g.27674 Transcript_19420/m.27674 type:complete len:161 (+) Transcript_19420:939-1421(+)